MRRLRLVHSSTWFEHSNVSSPTVDDDAAAAKTEPSALEPPRAQSEGALRTLDPTVQAMVEHLRIVAPLPRGVRARALARAQAAIAAQVASSSAVAPAPARLPWLGLLVSLMLAAAVGTAALVRTPPFASTFGMSAARTP